MRETTIARTYAEALLELARTDDAVELYAEKVRWIADLMEAETDFRSFLETPRIDASAKKQVIREVFESGLPDRLLKFLFVVIDRRRQRLLPSIAAEYAELVDQQFDRLQVSITTASEPDEALKADLKSRLSRLLNKEVLPHYRTDERIIGGVIVRVGDRIMDGSIRRRLHLLRRSLLKAEIG